MWYVLIRYPKAKLPTQLLVHPPPKEAQARRVGARNGNQWCHLFADTPEEVPELHRVAAAIGMKREWFQNHHDDFPHYDLVPSRRAAALKSGAVDSDRYDTVNAARRFRGQPPLDPERVAAGRARRANAR